MPICAWHPVVDLTRRPPKVPLHFYTRSYYFTVASRKRAKRTRPRVIFSFIYIYLIEEAKYSAAPNAGTANMGRRDGHAQTPPGSEGEGEQRALPSAQPRRTPCARP